MTTLDTLVEISALYSHNKYDFQAIDQVRNFLLTLLGNLFAQIFDNEISNTIFNYEMVFWGYVSIKLSK